MRPSDREVDVGLLVLRLSTGAILAYGTADNVFQHVHMIEFRDFLAKHGFPAPLFSAYLSAYAQFIGGILLAAGLLTRVAGAVMVINFVVALLMVHRGLPFGSNIAPLAMLYSALVLAITGPGTLSVDTVLARRSARR